ncbi:MAG: corrinoid protein [Deltaproteobacteria bacterium]|nr:corrinoid protein [Deltaproteobacteria bacterium]MBW2149693.1 corrinoid protein [Deltaproteobacteria bacterium]MBW2343390.1 corrinoid protein [Deltaproteobacteria bacterium]
MFSKLIKTLSELDREESAREVENLLEQGVDPFKIIEKGVMQGMDIVGERFESGEYFLPDLLRAAKAVEACSSIIKPLLREDQNSNKGTIVVGTVAGDIHDLGKNIVIATFESGGFKVVDVGVDVPIEKFIEAVKKENASILGMSALLTVTMVEMEKVIKALRSDPDLEKVKVMVGGAPVDQEYSDKIGADAYGRDARQALIKARELTN